MSNKMKVDLSGKTAIVTGAGGVIGKAISLALAANGAKVVLTGRSRGPLEIVENEIKAPAASARSFRATSATRPRFRIW